MNDAPTNEERWELIKRCLRLVEKIPRMKIRTPSGGFIRGGGSKWTVIDGFLLTKFYGQEPRIEIRRNSVLVLSAHAKETISRRLEHFEWGPPGDIAAALQAFRKHMLLDDLADI